jgi:hypothetical protein
MWNHLVFTNRYKSGSQTTMTISGFNSLEEFQKYKEYRMSEWGYSPSFGKPTQDTSGNISCEFRIFDSCD